MLDKTHSDHDLGVGLPFPGAFPFCDNAHFRILQATRRFVIYGKAHFRILRTKKAPRAKALDAYFIYSDFARSFPFLAG